MTEPTVEAYEQLLKQFYRKSIRTHSNRHELITKFIKISIGMKEQKPSEQQSAHISPVKSRPSLNVLDIRDTVKHKSSSRQNEPHSAKLFKNPSDQKSEPSNDSEFSNAKKKNREQQKYFNCDWVYRSSNFKKTLTFALIYMYFQYNDVYSFTKLKDNMEIYFEESSTMDKEARDCSAEWVKLEQTFHRKDRVRWSKMLPEIFINFTQSFINFMFEGLTRVKSEDIKSPSKEMIDSMSRNLKVNVNYFQIHHLEIEKIFQKSGSYKVDISVGYLREEDVYVFANKVPQKSEQEKKKDKAIKNISESIANLLKEYDANTQKLMSLDILSESNSKEANIKSYLSKKA